VIEKYGSNDFRLSCDHCENECDEVFETFDDAVDYKVDRSNGWASIKDKYGEWAELCPSCNKLKIIAELKGIELTAAEIKLTAMDLANTEFEGF